MLEIEKQFRTTTGLRQGAIDGAHPQNLDLRNDPALSELSGCMQDPLCS